MLGSAKTLKSNGHPFGVVLSRKTPGAEGTALLLVGPEPTRRRSARSHPARMTRPEGHHSPPRSTFRMSKAVRVSGSWQARRINAWTDFHSLSDKPNGTQFWRARNP